MKNNFIRKPLLTFFVVILIVAVIAYIELQKPHIISKETDKNSKYLKAPDFAADYWINSGPLTIDELKGKVVLVDFWTYTCINCIRTLPYLKEWDEKYRKMGLVIIGVHSPEFEFEKKYQNVLNAVNQYELKYPIAMDNEHATWSAYQNRFWPHKYLIDADGYIRYDHIGEGNYEETEKIIQQLLEERNNKSISMNITKPKEAVDVDFIKIRTPEIYFGYEFSRGNFGNKEGIKNDEIVDYNIPSSINPNQVYFAGRWKNNADNFELAEDSGNILLYYQAKDVNIVAGSENLSYVSVYLDRKILNESTKGSDFEDKAIIKESKLYNLVSADYKPYLINISVSGKGFRIYTFTFG